MIAKTCPHCGAPITGNNCEYCGAVFYDFSAIDISNTKPTYLKLKLPNGRIALMKALVDSFNLEYNTSPVRFYADSTIISCCEAEEIALSLDFRLLVDEDEILYKIVEGEKNE